MALIESLNNAVSGMLAQQTAINVISNNIANVNTTGFKEQTVLFKDVFYETIRPASPPTSILGGTNPQQSGLGVQVSSITSDFRQGAVNTDGVPSHAMITGQGFFVVKDLKNPDEFTRDGSFTLDVNQNLVTADGNYVQGWTADTNGNVNTGLIPGNLHIPIGQRANAVATTRVTYGGTLDSSSPLRPPLTASTPTTTATITGGQLDQAATTGASVTITPPPWIDAGGTSHTVSYTFTKDAAANTWDMSVNGITATGRWNGTSTNTNSVPIVFNGLGNVVSVNGVPGTTFTANIGDQSNTGQNVTISLAALTQGATPTTPTATGNGIVGPPDHTTSVQVYDSLGTPHTINLEWRKVSNNQWQWNPVAPNDPTISSITQNSNTVTYTTSGQPLTGVTPTITVSYAGGATTPQNITLDFSATTQLDVPDQGVPPESTSTLSALKQDGFPEGQLGSFSYANDGKIIGTFTNGQQKALGQLAIAEFNNPQGLNHNGDNLFSNTVDSGPPQIGTASDFSIGVRGGALEQSNVDLTTEFTKMIVTQRAFQANSRTITVSDDLLNTVIGLLQR